MKKKPAPSPDAPRRCAIYTRKSTTHGLDQEFNSLDAQREACAAYIKRQPNWTLVDEHRTARVSTADGRRRGRQARRGGRLQG
jgi:DNA invertase Pin-like site-specific DNA recombinase